MIDTIWIDPANVLPYIVLVCIYVVLSLASSLTKSRSLHVAAVALMIFFAGLRNPFTPDAARYQYFYEHSNDIDSKRLVEPTFFWLSKLLNCFTFDYHALFLVYTASTICLVYLGLRNLTPYIKTSMLLFLTVPHLYLGLFIEMRQDLAIAIVFYAISLRKVEGLRFHKVVIVALAFLSIAVHYSAAFFWIAFVILSKAIRRQFSLKLYAAVLGLSLLVPPSLVLKVLALAAYPVLPVEYRSHIDDLMQFGAALGAHSASSLFISNTLAIAFCYAAVRWKTIDRRDWDLVNLYFIGAVIVNLTRSYGDISRVAHYFIILEIALVPMLLFRAKASALRPVLVYCGMLLYIAHFIHGLYYLNEETDSYIFLHYSNALTSQLEP